MVCSSEVSRCKRNCSALARNAFGKKCFGRQYKSRYKNHPQLIRFKAVEKPLEAINQYLTEIWDEATRRGYNFDRNKIDFDFKKIKIEVTTGQMQYEFNHLLKKLEQRDPERFNQFENLKMIDCAEIFEVKEGEIEKWEIIS